MGNRLWTRLEFGQVEFRRVVEFRLASCQVYSLTLHLGSISYSVVFLNGKVLKSKWKQTRVQEKSSQERVVTVDKL